MTATIVPKKSRVKEPSLEQLAKQKAKGANGQSSRVKLGDWYDESLKRQLGEVLDGPPEMLARLTHEDRLAAAELLTQDALDDQQRTCAEMIVARAKPLQPHPATTSTTTPAGIAANDRSATGFNDAPVRGNGHPKNTNGNGAVPAERPRTNRKEKAPLPTRVPSADYHSSGGQSRPQAGQVVKIALDVLVRHPVNRHPTKESIAARAESMKGGQLEPILVRRHLEWGINGRYQILSGETRWLAAKKLGRETIDARIRECDDTQALESWPRQMPSART
jgi:uncharacterized ParB-like nuclease family protein